MSDLTLNIQARIEEAQRDLKKLEGQINRLESPKIQFQLPTLGETISGVQKLGSALKLTYEIAKLTPTKLGAVLNDVEEMAIYGAESVTKVATAIGMLGKATPNTILRSSLNAVNESAYKVSSTIASIGFEVFGVTQAVQLLNSTFAGFFNDTVGRQIRLNETILRTKTALVATTDVAVNGQKLLDPKAALSALDKPIDSVLANIRRRSLDIAGTTSEAIISVFQTVATQIGSFGGSLKDAEDLAITFSAALGTIGMSDPGMAMQEIRSILQGDITNDSILARSIGITNKDIQKAKQSAGGLVDFLQKRLEPFVAGQEESAKSFSGVTSNIQEIREEVQRAFGASALQPLLDFLTAVYKRLSLIFDQLTGIADTFGRMTSGVASGVLGGLMGAPQLKGFTDRAQLDFFKQAEQTAINFFKVVQNEIDELRPELNKLSEAALSIIAQMGQGLGALAAGFAQFKFEEFKVLFSQFITFAQVLNATVVPALNQILKLYGAFLQTDLATMVMELQVSFQALERVGILPLVRLGTLLTIAWVETLSTIKNWIVSTAAAVKSFAASVLANLGKVVTWIGSALANVGRDFTNSFQGIGDFLLSIAARVMNVIGMHFVSIGRFIKATFPQFAGLGQAIQDIGNRFKNTDLAIIKLQVELDKLGTKGRNAFEQLRKGAEDAGNAVRTFGTTLGNWLSAGINKLTVALRGLIVGMLKFQAIMFLTQFITANVTAIWARSRREVDRLTESNKAALAAERLVTMYQNIGESASLAAKAMRDYNKAIVEGRLDTLKTQLSSNNEELAKRQGVLNQFQRKGNLGMGEMAKFLFQDLQDSIANGDDALLSRWASSSNPRELLNRALQRSVAYARRDQRRTIDEADFLSEKLGVFEEAQAQSQTAEDLTLLRRERQDIEQVVKEMRLQIERDIKDERFRVEREVAQVQQQLREQQRQSERNDLERKLAAEQQGLTGIRAEVAQTLNQFQLGLFDAQTEAQRRQFEATERRIQLEKTIEDYKFGLEKQIADIRKRVSDYDMKVTDWKAKKAEEQRQKDLKAALYLEARKTEAFLLPGSQKEVADFRNAAVGNRFSPRQLLALLKSPGAVEALGVTDGMDPREVANRAAMVFPGFQGLDDASFLQKLNQRLEVARAGGLNVPAGGAEYLLSLAGSEVNNGRDFQRKVPEVPPLKGFGALDTAAYVAERKRLGEATNKAQSDFNAAVAELTKRETFLSAKARFENAESYTGLPSLATLDDQLTTLRASTEQLDQAFRDGKTTLSRLEVGQLSMIDTTTKWVKGFLDNAGIPMSARTGENNKQYNALISRITGSIASGNIDALDTIGLDEGLLKSEIANNPRMREYWGKIWRVMLDTVKKAFNDVLPDQLAKQTAIEAQTYKQEIQTTIRNLISQSRSDQLDLLSSFSEFDNEGDPLKRRQSDAELAILKEGLRLRELELDTNATAIAAYEDLKSVLRSNAETLGKFELSLKQAAESLGYARAAAQTLVDGYKGLVKGFLTGGDLKQGLDSMLRGFLDKVLDPVLEKAFKPMQDALEKQIRGFFNIKDPGDIVKEQYERIVTEQRSIFDAQKAVTEANTDALQNLTGALTGQGGPHTGIGGPDLWNSRSKTSDSGNYDSAGRLIPIGAQVGGPAYAPRAKPRSMQVDAPSTVVPIPVQPVRPASNPAALVESIFAGSSITLPDLKNLHVDIKKAYTELDTFKGVIKDVPQVSDQATNGLGQVMSGIAGLAAGALSIFGGISKMKEGGTQNTLLGLAGIFAGIGGIASGFGKGGAFAGLFRASGGPVSANRPYIVGEAGPELFLPDASGTVVPNHRLPFTSSGAAGSEALSPENENPYTSNLPFTKESRVPGTYIPFSRESNSTSQIIERSNQKTIEAIASAGPLKLEVETTTINNVEYVTADQHRKGMAEAATRGQQLTLAALQNSVRTRKKVGL